MSTEAGRAYVGLSYRGSDIGKLESDTERAGSGFVSSWSGFARKAALALGGAFAVKEVFAFAKDVTAEAAQTQKAVESIRAGFGSSADAVLQFGESAAKNFGIAREASFQFSSALAVTGRNIGLSTKEAATQAVGWQKLAGAVGLIKGQDPTSYFASLQRVMVGNARGLKQLGIAFSATEEQQVALRLGIKGQSGDWTAAQKAQILYQIAVKHLPELLKQASAHSGDLVDQQRKLSAEWQNVKADIGDALLPVMTRLVTVLAGALPAAFRIVSQGAKLFGAAIDAITTSSAGLAVVEHIIQPIKEAFHGLIGFIVTTKNQFDSFRASGQSLGKALQSTLVSAFERLGVSSGTVKRIMGALGQVADVARAAWRRFGTVIEFAVGGPLLVAITHFDQTKKVIAASVGFVRRYSEVFVSLGIAIGAIVGGLVAYTAATIAWEAAGAAATAVQAALNVAVAAFPAVVIIAGIIAIAAGLVYLYRNNETFHKAVVTAFRDVVKVVTTALHVVTGVIRTFVSVATGFWHTFGGAITKVARTDFNIVVGVIRGVLKIVEGVIKVALGIIHGNWSQAWSGIKLIARGAMQVILSIIRGAIGLAAAAARALGMGILHAIENAISGLAGFVRQKIGQIPGVIRGIIGSVASAAKDIGAAIIHGIENGVTGLASSLASKVKSTVTGALGSVGSALGIGSPSKWTRDHLGIPIIQGILAGFDKEGPGLATSLNRHVGRAVNVPLPSAHRASLAGIDNVGGLAVTVNNYVDGHKLEGLIRTEIKHDNDRLSRNLRAGKKLG